MKNEFILQSYVSDKLTKNDLYMITLSLVMLSIKNKVIFYCNDYVYNIINSLNIPNIEIVNDLELNDNDCTVVKAAVYKKFIGESFIHCDSDVLYDEKISFDDNDIIVGSTFHNLNTPNEWSYVFKKYYTNVLEEYPVIDSENKIHAFGHCIFGCKNQDLLEEYLENIRAHEIANAHIFDKITKHDKKFFYGTLEEQQFPAIANKYNLKIKVFEDYAKSLNIPYIHLGDSKHLNKSKYDIIEHLKHYNTKLYEKILNIKLL